jgi:hypothetical protein
VPAVRRTLRKPCGCVCAGVMAADALIDTGAILASLDRSDRWHGVCVEAFRQLRLPLVTSEVVLTELFHLVGDSRHETETACKLLRSGAITLAAIEDSELPEIQISWRAMGIAPWISPMQPWSTWLSARACLPSLLLITRTLRPTGLEVVSGSEYFRLPGHRVTWWRLVFHSRVRLLVREARAKAR